jgi:hypothetical protein
MKKILLFFCLLNAYNAVRTQDSLPIADTHILSLIFTGDIMGHDPQIEGAYDTTTGKYNYESTFRYIKDYIQIADIAIGNLEVTLAGPPFKGYPQFSSPDEIAYYAREAGFDILAQANNHALDGNTKGFIRTLDVLDTLKIIHFGTYRDSSERATYYPLIIEKFGIRIALLNYTYGTNGLEIPLPYIINRIDTTQIKKDIARANLVSPDLIIAFMHWGDEYERIENNSQVRLARYLVNQGVDAVIGSHPHVVQSFQYIQQIGDTVRNFPVFYSLGNFVSNQRAQYKDGGVIAKFYISKTDTLTTIDSTDYLPYWVWRQDNYKGKSTFYALPVSKWENDSSLFNLTTDDIFRLKRFATDTRQHIEGIRESSYYLKKADK